MKNIFYEANMGGFEDEEYVLRSQGVSRTRKCFRSTRYEDERVFGDEDNFEDVFEDNDGMKNYRCNPVRRIYRNLQFDNLYFNYSNNHNLSAVLLYYTRQ